MDTIFEKIDSEDVLLIYGDHYIKNLNVKVKIYSSSMCIVNLDNALKVGKTCTSYNIFAGISNWGDTFRYDFYVWLSENNLEMEDFIKNLVNGDYLDREDVRVTKREEKGINTFSPFVEIKAIKKPEKWTLAHVWKAILAGQIKKGLCTGYYTDDYARDAADNFKRGSISVLEIAKKLIESPSGWRVYVREEKEGILELTVNCYHFNNNSLYFEIEPKKDIKKRGNLYLVA